jgi:hypothetical protein
MLIEANKLAKPSDLPIEGRPLRLVQSCTTKFLLNARSRTTEGMQQEAAVYRIRSFIEGAQANVVQMITEYCGDSQQELF